MLSRFKPTVIAMLAGVLLNASPLSLAQEIPSTLPDIGTTAGATLSINQERVMGDFYLRQLRGGAPLINDPLLLQYINQLGGRLVTSADSVRTPFNFFLVNNDEINAFAFFGGNVVLHSGLFRYVENESELASILAHEISHVTQRHLARAMEAQKASAPLAWAGAFGSLLLAMANPQAGFAALSGTLAGAQQSVISFTQSNEQEADRIGIQVLQRAGFDPQAMPAFLQRLADMSRYATKPPEMLLTHPLPESRLADARNRANQMKATPLHASQDFMFAKVRVLGMYSSQDNPYGQALLDNWAKGNQREQLAAQYGRAIRAYQAKKYDEARNILQPLLEKSRGNLWFLDLQTDIDIGQQRAEQAVVRLQKMAEVQGNPVLELNLANALVESHKSDEACRILRKYTYAHPDDTNGWDLLAKASAAQNRRSEELAARAEGLALTGKLDQAIRLLSNASSQSKLGSLDQARYDARIDQLRALQQRFRPYEKS
ncbi:MULTISPECIES: beta-barrel assembly-enhancing protease [Dickeya]|uniref:Beta-barrel assembly-enhancing protease n=1 Tax=Dickeya aquatica TaxID=1401087 RepID=A0A375ACS3_9GAMM|nr:MULTISPECIES: M48 family metallopeptidase [Dickeya]SLM63904.1 chaperone/protease involved in the maintenance of OM integrity;Periplasmic predicted metalloprotease, required for LoiP localization (Lutticke, 2012) [Dickeya aquatica]